MRTLRFNAPPNNVLVDGEVRVEAGKTGEFEDKDAKRLLADPLIDVTEIKPPAAEKKTADKSADGADNKPTA